MTKTKELINNSSISEQDFQGKIKDTIYNFNFMMHLSNYLDLESYDDKDGYEYSCQLYCLDKWTHEARQITTDEVLTHCTTQFNEENIKSIIISLIYEKQKIREWVNEYYIDYITDKL